MRLQVEVAGLQCQLDNSQSEARSLRQAAIEDAKADAAERREMLSKHRQQLEVQQQQHAEQLAEAVAAAKVAERDRLRASVGPVLTAMQLQQERQVQEAARAKQMREALEAELVATRQLVFDALHDPDEVRLRLGL